MENMGKNIEDFGEWENPTVEELGDAKELIKGLNPVFDSKTSLVATDEFNATTS